MELFFKKNQFKLVVVPPVSTIEIKHHPFGQNSESVSRFKKRTILKEHKAETT